MNKTLIIAEAGVNHNGSMDLAKQLIDAASEAGADAVKFQTFKAEQLVSVHAKKADYQKKMTDKKENQLSMLKQLELSVENHVELISYAEKRQISFLSTPFDFDSVDILTDQFNLPIIKISSGEITNAPLILKIARKNIPVILSTGMSTIGEIEQALSVLAYGYVNQEGIPTIKGMSETYASKAGQAALQKNVKLLHCTTEYPTPFDEVNLLAMDTLSDTFNLPVGLSDHTNGIAIPIAAVARGAKIIEKHFTINRNLPGPDHAASLTPEELKLMVKSIREVELSLGTKLKYPTKSELKNIEIARKSIVAKTPILKGEIFSEDNITVKRPETGKSPYLFWDCIGKKADKDYEKDEVI